MNTLLVDAGNTRLKWAMLSDGMLGATWATHYQRGELAAGFAREWQKFCLPTNIPARVMVSNVAGPTVQAALAAWVKDRWALTIENVVAATSSHGVTNAYQQADTLGADRWAGLIAARHHINTAACVVDIGTATTIDVLDRGGKHLGGIITPGVELMRASLTAHTDGIASAQIVEHDTSDNDESTASNGLGTSTLAGVRNGTLMAAAGLIRLTLQRVAATVTGPLHCVLTGGGAPAVMVELQAGPPLGWHCHHEPDWVLKGMQVIADGPKKLVEQDAAQRPLETKR
ncbi:MAG: type III pantothenate kinase [Gammaproteobacteria bacterium]|nr:type III pantothenate kinase [Gammaproteobacteria bacterium]